MSLCHRIGQSFVFLAGMVGDVNLFFNDEDASAAEIEVRSFTIHLSQCSSSFCRHNQMHVVGMVAGDDCGAR